MQLAIDDSLLKRAQQLSGLSDYRAVVEEALRVLIEKRQQTNDVAGCLSQYAHNSVMPFAQERELAWSKVTDETHRT
jgi:hypothetical protein